MPQEIAPDDPRLSWCGAVSLEKTRQGIKPWRIFHGERELYFPQLMERTQKSSGVRLAFFSDSRRVSGDIVGWHEPSHIDVRCVSGRSTKELIQTIELRSGAERFEAAEILRQRGDKQVRYVHGPQFLSRREAALFRDGAHPKPEGYELWGERFARKMGPWFR